MEAFSLLKYWRSSNASSANATADSTPINSTTGFVSNVIGEEVEEQVHADDGPFFDMEFTVEEHENAKNRDNVVGLRYIKESDDESDDCDCVNAMNRDNVVGLGYIKESDDESDDCDCVNEGEDEAELKFTLSSASSADSIDPNISLSPSDDLFFKGRLVPEADNDPNNISKPVSKSLRVLMLKLKKSTKLGTKTGENEENVVKPDKEETKEQRKQSTKFFTVKFKVDEVPVLSMFTRDNSSKAVNTKITKENLEKSTIIEEEEKVFSKDTVNKYLNKVKPLYFRVSKRYGEKLGFSGHFSPAGAMKVRTGASKASELSQADSTQLRNMKSLKQGISFPGKLRVVRKQLGKSKSASSTVTAAADSTPVVMVAKRRDDSLLQQQDGIQSAIMHCKRSFKASRELEGKGGNGDENVLTADLSGSVDKAKGDKH
ncbi:putative membrane-associated kinase regulator 2 [Apium graveolens]|uniref:putative membrane-associated kinase regulator 2 n=1 Tax=Apium graveolens TaxID=4045 RepID=UPI003D7ABAC8